MLHMIVSLVIGVEKNFFTLAIKGRRGLARNAEAEYCEMLQAYSELKL